MKFSPRERIVKAKIHLQKQSPFFAHLVMNMNIREDKSIPTMGVNFKGNAVYNPEFITELSDSQIKGVLCHEVMHVALCHLLRAGKRDHMLFNVSADLLINWMITKENYDLPEGVLLPTPNGDYTIDTPDKQIEINVEGKTAEEIYDILNKELPPAPCSGGSSGQGEGEGEGDNRGLPKGFDEHIYGEELSESQKRVVEKEWKGKLVDAATAAKTRGSLPGYMERLLDELLHPKLNWKSILYQYLTKDLLYNFTYRRPGRRSYSTGIYTPMEIKENLDITVTIDCSGSISQKEYTDFVSEVIGIANAFEQIKMNLVYWDTEIRNEIEVTRSNQKDLIEAEVPGGGGTSISCLQDKYRTERPPQLMVHLTDGYIEDSPELPYSKHLFVLSKGGTENIVQKYGIVTKLEHT